MLRRDVVRSNRKLLHETLCLRDFALESPASARHFLHHPFEVDSITRAGVLEIVQHVRGCVVADQDHGSGETQQDPCLQADVGILFGFGFPRPRPWVGCDSRRQRVPYGARVRELLVRESAPHRVTMMAIAPRLGVSLRSLHRRLVDEGQSFTALANEAAGVVAKRLLAEEGRTIQEVSGSMGFSDANAFHRAFKRWTGTTPMRFLACR